MTILPHGFFCNLILRPALLFQVFAELIKSPKFLVLFSSSGLSYASYRHYR